MSGVVTSFPLDRDESDLHPACLWPPCPAWWGLWGRYPGRARCPGHWTVKKKKRKKVFHLFPRGYYSHGEKSPHREGFQSSRLQLFFKRWLVIQHITHATAPLFHVAVARRSIPVTILHQTAETPPLSPNCFVGLQYFQVLFVWNPLSNSN